MYDSLHRVQYLGYLVSRAQTLVDSCIIVITCPLGETQCRNNLGQRSFDLMIQIHTEIFERVDGFVYGFQILSYKELPEKIKEDTKGEREEHKKEHLLHESVIAVLIYSLDDDMISMSPE